MVYLEVSDARISVRGADLYKDTIEISKPGGGADIVEGHIPVGKYSPDLDLIPVVTSKREVKRLVNTEFLEGTGLDTYGF